MEKAAVQSALRGAEKLLSPARNYMAIAGGKKTLAQIRLDAHKSETATRVAEKLLSPQRKTINKALTHVAKDLPDHVITLVHMACPSTR